MTNQEPEVGSQQTSPPSPLADAQLGQEPKPARNVLALVALIVSIVGFVFACIPGALVVGWILLPIAFILAIVSLFMKGKGKGLGIAGLIISVVGTVVGVLVFFAVAAASFNSAFGNGTTVVAIPTEAGQAPVEGAAAVGSRENPAALGSEISSDNWTVVVNSYNADGNAVVAAANSFNDAAPAGSHYEIVNYTVTYTGTDSTYAAEVGVDVVTSAGNVIDSFDNFVVLEDSFGLDELFKGASATGSVAFLVPDGESVVIRVRPGFIADDVFVAT